MWWVPQMILNNSKIAYTCMLYVQTLKSNKKKPVNKSFIIIDLPISVSQNFPCIVWMQWCLLSWIRITWFSISSLLWKKSLKQNFKWNHFIKGYKLLEKMYFHCKIIFKWQDMGWRRHSRRTREQWRNSSVFMWKTWCFISNSPFW